MAAVRPRPIFRTCRLRIPPVRRRGLFLAHPLPRAAAPRTVSASTLRPDRAHEHDTQGTDHLRAKAHSALPESDAAVPSHASAKEAQSDLTVGIVPIRIHQTPLGQPINPQVVVHDPRPSTHTITNGQINQPITPEQDTSTRSRYELYDTLIISWASEVWWRGCVFYPFR